MMERTPPRIRIGEVSALTRYIEWDVIVADINTALGMPTNSRVRVAEILNVPITTVQRWLEPQRGGQTKQIRDIAYAHGEALLDLHRLACGAERTLERLRTFRERATRSAS